MNQVATLPPVVPLVEMTIQDLKAELARSLETTAENLAHLARVWRELERRGEDLSSLRNGLRGFLPLIADGRLDAQVAVQFAGNLTMLRALASQPLSLQKRIAAGEKLPVVIQQGGALIDAMRSADDLTAAQIRLIFHDGAVRGPDEQRAVLASTDSRTQSKRRIVHLRLTEDEATAIEEAASAAGMTLSAFVMEKTLGLRTNGDGRMTWSPTDDALLRRLVREDELKMHAIAARLRRSVSAVQQRVTRLKKDGAL